MFIADRRFRFWLDETKTFTGFIRI